MSRKNSRRGWTREEYQRDNLKGRLQVALYVGICCGLYAFIIWLIKK